MLDDRSLSELKKLCRLEYTPEEEQKFCNSLGRVLDYVRQIEEIDTAHVRPCSYPLRETFPPAFREDEVKETLSHEVFLANAPDQVGGMIRVPPILREEP